jgi:hypothetical protein
MPELDMVKLFSQKQTNAEIKIFTVDKPILINLSEGRNFKGQCSSCNKTSFGWPDWRHVEMWYKNHKCVNGLPTSKNGKR